MDRAKSSDKLWRLIYWALVIALIAALFGFFAFWGLVWAVVERVW